MTTSIAGAALPVIGKRPRGFRPDIQALRAVAIAAVVLNHLWPLRFPGGYVGVDVFFVISGFLITGHLVREASATGRVALASFYARRVRRLLPAALLVLCVAAVAAWIFLPYPRWERNGAEILASAAYVENWFLAAMSVNYSALNDSATVAQHYWSLSVEEQFYLIWPVVILVGWVWAVRRAVRPRIPVTIALAVIGALSLAASVVFTALSPSAAYFVTFTRIWEFAGGGLLALVASRIRLGAAPRNILALGGYAAIGASVILFGPATAFPGVLALVPVLGTVAVIAAGMHGGRNADAVLTSSRPVQWLGDVSYSLYLWHWPIIVVAPFVLQSEPSTMSKVGALILALVLAWLTRRWVEIPGQRWRAVGDSPKRTFLAMGIGMGATIVVGALLLVAGTVRTAADVPPDTVEYTACTGPLALAPGDGCADPFGPAGNTDMGPRNRYYWSPKECGAADDRLRAGDKRTTVVCDFSDGEADAAQVWLVGDSHAQQWQNTIFDLARERGWVVTTSMLGGCPAADVAFLGYRALEGPERVSACRRWSAALTAEIAKDAPDLVFTSMAAREQLLDDASGVPAMQQWVSGLSSTWRTWTDAGVSVVVLADPPLNGEVRATDCVALNRDDPLACAVDAVAARQSDPLVVAATTGDATVALVDLTSSFCDDASCYAVVGGIPVYYDADHLNLEYVRLLKPALVQSLSSQGVLP